MYEEVVAGTELPGVGGTGRLDLTPHCHHHNDSCTQVGSDENQFNVSLIVRDSHETASQTTTFEERGDPQTEAILLTSLTQ